MKPKSFLNLLLVPFLAVASGNAISDSSEFVERKPPVAYVELKIYFDGYDSDGPEPLTIICLKPLNKLMLNPESDYRLKKVKCLRKKAEEVYGIVKEVTEENPKMINGHNTKFYCLTSDDKKKLICKSIATNLLYGGTDSCELDFHEIELLCDPIWEDSHGKNKKGKGFISIIKYDFLILFGILALLFSVGVFIFVRTKK